MTKTNVFLTGSNGSLGRSMIKKFNTNDYNLILHSRKAKKLKSKSSRFDYILGDLSKSRDLENIINNLKKKRIDIFINNAGIHRFDSVKNFNNKILRKIFEINFFSSAIISQVIFKRMLSINNGLIVNINSVASKQASGNELSYCASKAALKSLSETFQINSFGTNVEIINLYPGAFKSKMTKTRTNYNNLMEPDEIADVVFDICKKKKTLKISDVSVFRK